MLYWQNYDIENKEKMENAFEKKKSNRNLFLLFLFLLKRKILRAKDILWYLWIEILNCCS